ncbi:hypothetical protein DRN52_07370 [Thermococci archaeon]|nr:MAG: hypothetical protein DRN52_07370 [Thermococci archaeon]
MSKKLERHLRRIFEEPPPTVIPIPQPVQQPQQQNQPQYPQYPQYPIYGYPQYPYYHRPRPSEIRELIELLREEREKSSEDMRKYIDYKISQTLAQIGQQPKEDWVDRMMKYMMLMKFIGEKEKTAETPSEKLSLELLKRDLEAKMRDELERVYGAVGSLSKRMEERKLAEEFRSAIELLRDDLKKVSEGSKKRSIAEDLRDLATAIREMQSIAPQVTGSETLQMMREITASISGMLTALAGWGVEEEEEEEEEVGEEEREILDRKIAEYLIRRAQRGKAKIDVRKVAEKFSVSPQRVVKVIEALGKKGVLKIRVPEEYLPKEETSEEAQEVAEGVVSE